MNTIGTRTIETDRLVLRRYSVEDAQDMFDNWASDNEVTRFLTWPTHTDVEGTKSILTEWVSYYDDGGTYNWGITLKGEDHVIGNIAVVHKDLEMCSYEVGYCLGKKYWGKGIMPEALKAVIGYLFDGEKDLNRITATHDLRNGKSGRVMQKAGMHFDGSLRASKKNKSGFHDTAYYSVLRCDIVSEEEYEKLFLEMHPNFFEREYVKATAEGKIASELLLRLQEFDASKYKKTFGDDVTFGFYDGSLEELHKAVEKVNPKWVKNFTEDMRVYCGFIDGNIASFCIIDDFGTHEVDGMTWKIAGPGCVGTLPEYRDRGIGLSMVSQVTEILRDELYDYSYIFYTYVDKWYEKLGYKTILKWDKHGFVK